MVAVVVRYLWWCGSCGGLWWCGSCGGGGVVAVVW